MASAMLNFGVLLSNSACPRRKVRCWMSTARWMTTAIPDLRLLSLSVELDRQIVGQTDAKLAVLLGLLAREHVYIEGPPGVGKTHLAEVASSTAGLSRFMYQFHRDTRVDELIGDATIMRETVPEGEVIRQSIRPGGILTCQICVLDDISRAPGEALNVLLRLLNERRYLNKTLMLRCAIATGNPTREEFFNEPLDPSVMDRFALQVSVGGLVRGKDWDSAARVIRQHCEEANHAKMFCIAEDFNADFWETLDADLCKVEFPEELLQKLLAVLDSLASEPEVEHSQLSLLTDRTFLVKAPRIMRAHAILEGRTICTEKDLQVLRLMTRFRVPESVHARIDDIIARAARGQDDFQEPNDKTPGSSSSGSAAGNGLNGLDPPNVHVPKTGDEQAKPASDGLSRFLQYVTAALDRLFRYLEPDPAPSLNLDHHIEGNMRIEGAEALLSSLHGSLQRSVADRWFQPGGLPRGWRTMRSLRETVDADITALARWCDLPTPTLPRAVLRQRIDRGGAMAIIRDVSDSMRRPNEEYLLARCASATTCGIVELAQQSGMRVGYLEFGDLSRKYFTQDSSNHFFTRDYCRVKKLAQNLGTRGGTHYQLALQEVLDEFDQIAQTRGLHQRMHVVMLSDGEPTMGCRELHDERMWAQRLGVCIHTVFIGDGHYPPELARLAVDTNGKRFHAVPDYNTGTIEILDVSNHPVFEKWNWRALFSGPRPVSWDVSLSR